MSEIHMSERHSGQLFSKLWISAANNETLEMASNLLEVSIAIQKVSSVWFRREFCINLIKLRFVKLELQTSPNESIKNPQKRYFG